MSQASVSGGWVTSTAFQWRRACWISALVHCVGSKVRVARSNRQHSGSRATSYGKALLPYVRAFSPVHSRHCTKIPQNSPCSSRRRLGRLRVACGSLPWISTQRPFSDRRSIKRLIVYSSNLISSHFRVRRSFHSALMSTGPKKSPAWLWIVTIAGWKSLPVQVLRGYQQSLFRQDSAPEDFPVVSKLLGRAKRIFQ